MSTSTKAVPKPKRPLSGYNLFYRYKRNKVVEATARADATDDEHSNKAVIHAVLTALPGLEDVPPAFPLCDLPPARLNEIRAARIRSAMEGKLFPNEDPSRRLHCKVHGMGFVEMGRVMRQMWAQADKPTKDVFDELADVGRVRYRRLVAEYKLGGKRPENVESETVEKLAATASSSPSNLEATAAVESTAKVKASQTSPIPQQVQSTSNPMLEAPSVWATKNTPPTAVAASSESKNGSRPTCGRRVSLDPYSQKAPVPSEAQSNPTARAGVRPNECLVPTAAELCDDSLFEPLPIHTVTVPNAAMDAFEPLPLKANDFSATPKTSGGHGRRVSTDVSSLLNGSMGAVGAPTAGAMGNGNANSHSAHANLPGPSTNLRLQQMVLRNAIKNLQEKIIQNNSMLPSNMRLFPQGGTVPQGRGNNVGGTSRLGIVTSGGPSIPPGRAAVAANANPGGGADAPSNQAASAQGSVEFVDELAEAIDHHGIVGGAIREDLASGVARGISHGRGLAFVSGKPAFPGPLPALGSKPASSPRQATVPMPLGIELRNHRARMA